MRIVYNLDADGEQVLCYTIINLFVRLPEQEVIMKQPDKMIAYYYRVEQKQTDLHLDNQMHQLLCDAAERANGNYLLYADNGYSGLTADRPAFRELSKAMSRGSISGIVAYDISRISRNQRDLLRFLRKAEKYGISVTLLIGSVPHAVLGLYEALHKLADEIADEKGGDLK